MECPDDSPDWSGYRGHGHQLEQSANFQDAADDAHKYIIGGILEIGIEAVTTHYLRNHDPTRKWYWRALWTLPQSLSVYGHARAAIHNAALPY
jgi:hypothetical protein